MHTRLRRVQVHWCRPLSRRYSPFLNHAAASARYRRQSAPCASHDSDCMTAAAPSTQLFRVGSDSDWLRHWRWRPDRPVRGGGAAQIRQLVAERLVSFLKRRLASSLLRNRRLLPHSKDMRQPAGDVRETLCA